MRRMGDREQRYAYLGAAVAAMASVALWAPAFDQTAARALAAIGVVMAGLLAAAARRRSRLFSGLAAVLLAFGPWGMAWVIGLPYLVLAGWLALKSPRLRVDVEPEVDDHDAVVRPARAAREPRRARAARRARQSASEAGGSGGTRTPPPASRRYTPPQRRR